MARVAINTGAAANDGTGDTLRAAGGVINNNFLEVYTYLGAGSTTTLSAPVWSTTNAGINTLRNVGIGTTNPRFALEVGAVGSSGTSLYVNGDARITGILTIGTSSITLNGATNIINVGTGITINGSTGIISATSIVVGGTTLTGAAVTRIEAGSGISVDQNTGQVTITATGGGGETGAGTTWVATNAGIHTTKNVGIGTTNPTSKLTVTGDGTFTGVVTATTFIGALTGTATTATGLSGTPNITVGTIGATSLNASGVTTSGTLNVGTGGTVITTTSAGLVGIGTTNPTSKLTVGAVGAATTNLVVNGWANISGMNIVQDTDTNSIYIGYEAGQSLLDQANDNGNIALGYRSLYGSTSPDYCIAIGYQALENPTNNTDNTIAIGYQAGRSGGGGANVFIGHDAGESATTGHSNVAIGYEAAQNGNPHFGVYIGYDAGKNADADGNVFVGYAAGEDVTFGDYNTFIGRNAGNDMTTGDDNVIIGGYQGNQSGLDIRTSSNNVVLSDGDGNIRFYANSSGNVGLGTTNPTSALTVVGSGTSTSQLFVTGVSTLGTVQVSSGIITATSGVVTYHGDTSNAADGRWTLGASGSNHYTFVGIGFTETTNDPVLYLTRGRVYEFVNNSGGSHPFQIRVGNGGAAYSNGVTNNGASSGTIRFEVPFSAPNTLYYQCTNHSGMGATIFVTPRNEPAVGVRTTVTATTGSVGAADTTNLNIDGFKTYSLLKVGITSAAWVVLYTDATSRTNDESRSHLTDPTPGSGVIAEVRTTSTGVSTFIMSPGVIGWNNDVSVASTIYARVTNNESSTSTGIGVTLTVVKLED